MSGGEEEEKLLGGEEVGEVEEKLSDWRRRRKKPKIGRYPMGLTKIHLHPSTLSLLINPV